MPQMMKAALKKLRDKLRPVTGEIGAEGLYVKALTHPSSDERLGHENQRLELLGDAVLGLAISEYLYENLPTKSEGELTQIKSVLASTKVLSRVGRDLGLADLIKVGKGIDLKKIPDSIIEDTVEALIAAIYLDCGYRAAKAFVAEFIMKDYKNRMSSKELVNYKTKLQEHCQKHCSGIPSYEVVGKSGPDHNKSFEVVVRIQNRVYGPARGKSKKEAEQSCARIALDELGVEV